MKPTHLLSLLTPMIGLVWTALSAQSVEPKFEVASIKENVSSTTRGMLALVPGGGVMGRHTSIATMIRFSYGLEDYQLANAPAWIRSTYYDVNGKASAPGTRSDALAMLRSLLADRFGLRVHEETRLLRGYALTVTDAMPRSRFLERSEIDCLKEQPPACREGFIAPNRFKQVGLPIERLVSALGSAVDAPVTDQTGLTGPYNVELHWSREDSPDGGAPVIFTAIQEQLGLRLRGGRFPHVVVVVDHVERPTPD